MSVTKALQGEFSFFDDADSARQHYQEFGFHIEKNIFSADECEQLIDASYDLSGAKQQDFKPAMMPHREHAVFLDPIKKPAIVDIIQQTVGGTAVGLQSTFFYCRPGTRGFSFHQDNFFLQAKFGVFVSTWIALVDTYPDNGGLIIYPQSHQAGDLPVRKLQLNRDVNQDPNANNEETVVPPNYLPTNLCIPKGSVLFIHGHIVHGSHPNKSNANRYVLLNTYVKQGETYRSGNYAKREPIPLQ